jgi:hypothetical protein
MFVERTVSDMVVVLAKYGDCFSNFLVACCGFMYIRMSYFGAYRPRADGHHLTGPYEMFLKTVAALGLHRVDD